jgi:integrase
VRDRGNIQMRRRHRRQLGGPQRRGCGPAPLVARPRPTRAGRDRREAKRRARTLRRGKPYLASRSRHLHSEARHILWRAQPVGAHLGVRTSRSIGGLPSRTRRKGRVNRGQLAAIDLHWHDLRHEAACRWLARGLDVRAIQLLLGHADLKTTQRYLNVTDEELRKTMQHKLWSRK